MESGNNEENHFNCIIMGAGISGLDAAYHMQTYCPWASYAILERRSNLGGTWDFFKYPGTAVCRKMFDLPFYSSKRPILRVVGGAEGVVPHPHMGGTK